MGWGALAESGVDVIEIAGNHFTIVREPLVKALADRLKEFIDRVFAP
jgi:thioesterase domain-containing protein